MKVLVPVIRVIDYNVKVGVKVGVKADWSGVDLASGDLIEKNKTIQTETLPRIQKWNV